MSAIEGIRKVEETKDTSGKYKRVRVTFGPHYCIELNALESGGVSLSLVATHHGFRADASKVNGELEKIIQAVRGAFPKNLID